MSPGRRQIGEDVLVWAVIFDRAGRFRAQQQPCLLCTELMVFVL